MQIVYKIDDVVDYIIYYSNQKDYQINNRILQKLLFFVQIESIMENDALLFKDQFSLWSYGPVIPHIYSKYKFNVSTNIKSTKKERYIISLEHKKSINKMIDEVSKYSTLQILNISTKMPPFIHFYNSIKNDITKDKNIYLTNKMLVDIVKERMIKK